MDPLCVHVGLEEDLDPEARTVLIVAESERVGGFEQSDLVIALPIGTGWLDAGSFAPMEHLLESDAAIVLAHYPYFYTPSRLSSRPARASPARRPSSIP